MQNMIYRTQDQHERAQEALNMIAEVVDEVHGELNTEPEGLDYIAVGDAFDNLETVQDGINWLAGLLGVTVEW